jgi:hypothetical protein
MSNLIIPLENVGEVSDGYHTFNELYDHRCILWVHVLLDNKNKAFRTKKHVDGSEWEGWFVAGLEFHDKQMTYHLPNKYWDLLDGIETMPRMVYFDGHTSQDVHSRLVEWAKTKY